MESAQLHFPRFLRREGDHNFRILKDVLEPSKAEMTFSDFERCVQFNRPNHVVRVSLLGDTHNVSPPKKNVSLEAVEKKDQAIEPKDTQASQQKETGSENPNQKQSILVSEIQEKAPEARTGGKEREFVVSKMEAREIFLENNILMYGDARQEPRVKNELLISKEVDPEAKFVELFMIIEMGRQSIMDGRNKERILRENQRKAQKNINKKIGNDDEMDSKKVEAAIQLQKFIRGFQARKKTRAFRRHKMEFLGLSIFNEHTPQTQNKSRLEIVQQVDKVAEKRKARIVRKLGEMMEQRKLIKEELRVNEGPEIKEKMLEERRNFILDFYEMHEGKQLPKNEKVFYQRFELKDIKNLEENAKKMKKKSRERAKRRKPKETGQKEVEGKENGAGEIRRRNVSQRAAQLAGPVPAAAPGTKALGNLGRVERFWQRNQHGADRPGTAAPNRKGNPGARGQNHEARAGQLLLPAQYCSAQGKARAQEEKSPEQDQKGSGRKAGDHEEPVRPAQRGHRNQHFEAEQAGALRRLRGLREHHQVDSNPETSWSARASSCRTPVSAS